MNPAGIYADFNALSELKAKAGKDAGSALDQVARQFESLFIHQMLKSMREASLGDGLLDSDQSLFYRDMFDQQLSVHLAESGGIGLAASIKRQIGGDNAQVVPARGIASYRSRPVPASQAPTAALQADISADTAITAVNTSEKTTSIKDPAHWQPEEFVKNLMPWARAAAGKLGLAPQALLAQAALETGWGRKLMRLADGSPANNLFGIKADHRWSGDKVSVDTLEYEQGAAVKKKAHFRAYGSFGESFQDYVAFLSGNPRYRRALEVTAEPGRYFSALQEAGYATDPRYAQKIESLLNGPEMQRALQRLKAQQGQPL